MRGAAGLQRHVEVQETVPVKTVLVNSVVVHRCDLTLGILMLISAITFPMVAMTLPI